MIDLNRSAVVFVSGSAPVVIAPSLTLTDADSTQIASARIEFVDYTYNNQFRFYSVVAELGINNAYSYIYGSNVITGTFDISGYQTWLREVEYRHTVSFTESYTKVIKFMVFDTDGNASSSFMTLHGLTPFDNIKAYANGEMNAVTPTDAHYESLDMVGYVSGKASEANAFIVGKTFNTIAELNAVLAADADGDRSYDYFDTDNATFSIDARYLFEEHAPSFIDTDGDLIQQNALIHVSAVPDSTGTSHEFTVSIEADGVLHLKDEWPYHLATALNNQNVSQYEAGETEFMGALSPTKTVSGNYIRGASDIQVRLITEFFTIQNYLDSQSSNDPPSVSDYQASLLTGVNEANVEGINAYLVSLKTSDSSLNTKAKYKRQSIKRISIKMACNCHRIQMTTTLIPIMTMMVSTTDLKRS